MHGLLSFGSKRENNTDFRNPVNKQKKVHAKNAKKDAKIPEPNFALFCGFVWLTLREIL